MTTETRTMNSFRSQARKETKALREMYLAAKLDYEEALYYLDGRDDPNHPHHERFTGLIKKYCPSAYDH